MFTKVYTKSPVDGKIAEHADGTKELFCECLWESGDELVTTGIPNMAPGCEMDTGKLFYFSKNKGGWQPYKKNA